MLVNPLDRVALTTCADADLLATQTDLVGERRAIDVRLAAVAAEIARRSSPDAGMAGLAQHTGDRTAARLIERTTGIGADEARRLIGVGARLGDPDDPVGAAVMHGSLSVTAASAIAGELDRIVGDVSAERIRDAAAALVEAAPTLGVGELRREARAVRDDLDAEGIPEREERLRQRRRLALTRLADGMTRLDGLLDPESAALVGDAFDQALSPRRGGPRFADPAAVERAERLLADPRTTEQLMVDTLVQIVRLAASADDGEVFGQNEPAVRVHVAAADLAAGTVVAIFEGQDATVSAATAERLTCTGAVAIRFDPSGQPIDLGREQRLYTRRQRRALAARDGGCLHPGCDRPPSWTEAHHIDEWVRDRGCTDVARGVLLCAFHHHWLHTHRHRIQYRDDSYGLVHGDTGEFSPWPSKNLIRRRLVPTG